MLSQPSDNFTDEEAAVLRRYFTNLDGPVFALVNLPEVVKGALFARYSRSPKSLRRLFLDEFVGDLDLAGDRTFDATIGLERAEKLYDKVFFEYGDDSVAQLGGVHLACEEASNLLTKVLERGRLMSYLEQSTRYISYDSRLPNGRYRYYRDQAVLGSPLGARYVGDIDRMFDTYSELVPTLRAELARSYPRPAGTSDFAWRRSVRALALDSARGLLPAASLSNVGLYGSGQAYEALLLRMRSHPLPEARAYAELAYAELRKVVPSFLKRLEEPSRGGAWSRYLEGSRSQTAAFAAQVMAGPAREAPDGPAGSPVLAGEALTGVAAWSGEGSASVKLVDFDPQGEDKLLAAVLYPHTQLSDAALLAAVARMTLADRHRLMAAYVGDRRNRRHRPGRAFERCWYRFEIVSDYGAFRDLQRHRMLTIEWQPLGTAHGFMVPEVIAAAGLGQLFEDSLARSAELHDVLAEVLPDQAAYAVALAFRLRYSIEMNAREAMHMIELRSSEQGHPAYRFIAQEMHRQIAEVAGHRSVAGAMSFADHSPSGLGRLSSEVKAEARREGAL
ncbi:MAG: FAD-dependent thymidylate synthase [Acidimicrobiales bacterium]